MITKTIMQVKKQNMNRRLGVLLIEDEHLIVCPKTVPTQHKADQETSVGLPWKPDWNVQNIEIIEKDVKIYIMIVRN
jgi:hypothetical protein